MVATSTMPGAKVARDERLIVADCASASAGRSWRSSRAKVSRHRSWFAPPLPGAVAKFAPDAAIHSQAHSWTTAPTNMDQEQPSAPANTVDELKNFLAQTVRRHHETTREGMLLANLGWAVNNQRPDLRAGFGQSRIGEFVQRELGDLVLVQADPDKPSVKVAYPTDALRALGPSTDPRANPSSGPRQYAHAVMLAFTRTVAPQRQRFLFFPQTSIFYRDVAVGSAAPANGFRIDNDFIAEPVDGIEVNPLDDRVDRWLAEHGLPLTRVLEQPKLSLQRGSKHANLLDQLLNALTDGERKRIQMPLDVIAKLRNVPK